MVVLVHEVEICSQDDSSLVDSASYDVDVDAGGSFLFFACLSLAYTPIIIPMHIEGKSNPTT